MFMMRIREYHDLKQKQINYLTFVQKLFIYSLFLCICECSPLSLFICCEISRHSSTSRSFCFERLIGEQLNLPINCSGGCTCEICLCIVYIFFKSFPCFMHVCAHLQHGCVLALVRLLLLEHGNCPQ